MKKFSVFLCGLVLVLAACSSNPHKAEKVETVLKSEGDVAGETVGIKNGEMVVQRKVMMSEELRRIQNEVFELEDHVYGNNRLGSKGLYGVLKDCRMQLTDRRMGGTGKLMWTEPIERLTDKEEPMKVGVDEKEKLVGISEEYLKDRIARFQDYKRTYLKREEEYQTKVDVCKADVRARKSDIEAEERASLQKKADMSKTEER
jgi:hypothetical protein